MEPTRAGTIQSLKSKIHDFETLSHLHVYCIEYVSYQQGLFQISIDTAADHIVPALEPTTIQDIWDGIFDNTGHLGWHLRQYRASGMESSTIQGIWNGTCDPKDEKHEIKTNAMASKMQ